MLGFESSTFSEVRKRFSYRAREFFIWCGTIWETDIIKPALPNMWYVEYPKPGKIADYSKSLDQSKGKNMRRLSALRTSLRPQDVQANLIHLQPQRRKIFPPFLFLKLGRWKKSTIWFVMNYIRLSSVIGYSSKVQPVTDGFVLLVIFSNFAHRVCYVPFAHIFSNFYEPGFRFLRRLYRCILRSAIFDMQFQSNRCKTLGVNLSQMVTQISLDRRTPIATLVCSFLKFRSAEIWQSPVFQDFNNRLLFQVTQFLVRNISALLNINWEDLKRARALY